MIKSHNDMNLENYIKELKQIYYVISSMQKSSNLSEILDTILSTCLSLTHTQQGLIAFRHMQSNKLYIPASQGISTQSIEQANLFVGDGITGTVIAEGNSKIINDITLDPKYIPLDPSSLSEMVVPIMVNNKPFGAIVIDHTEVNAFTDKHLEIVQMIGSHTGFIISHYIESLLAEKTKRLLHSILTLNSSTPIEEIFVLLNRELKSEGSCVLDSNGAILLQEGDLQEELSLNKISNNAPHTEILATQNEQQVPYTRLIIPNIHQGLTYVTDKIYYFMENAQIDIDFAHKVMEVISSKKQDLDDELLLNWLDGVIANTDDNNVYNEAIHKVEKELIKKILAKNNNNKLQSSINLGINRNTLKNKMAQFDI